MKGALGNHRVWPVNLQQEREDESVGLMCVGEPANRRRRPTKPNHNLQNRNFDLIVAPSSGRVCLSESTERLLASFISCVEIMTDSDVFSRSVFMRWFQGNVSCPFSRDRCPTEPDSVLLLPSSVPYYGANPWPTALRNRCHVHSIATADSNRGFSSVTETYVAFRRTNFCQTSFCISARYLQKWKVTDLFVWTRLNKWFQ